ncbi:Suppressor of mec-8 and unc-52 protein-like protein, partial [Smittium mucronatum]
YPDVYNENENLTGDYPDVYNENENLTGDYPDVYNENENLTGDYPDVYNENENLTGDYPDVYNENENLTGDYPDVYNENENLTGDYPDVYNENENLTGDYPDVYNENENLTGDYPDVYNENENLTGDYPDVYNENENLTAAYPDVYNENENLTGDYPDVYNENENGERLGGEDSVTGFYPLDSFDGKITADHNSISYQNKSPEELSENDDLNSEMNYNYNLDLDELKQAKNKGLASDSLVGGYGEYIDDISSGEEGEDDIIEDGLDTSESKLEGDLSLANRKKLLLKSSQMDVGSVSKFKKTQLSKYDFDSIEEWEKYKDNQVQLPKAAFQFGIKSKDSTLNKNRSSAKIRNLNKRNHALGSVDSQTISAEGQKESKKKAKLDREWQATRNYMSEKYGESYFG